MNGWNELSIEELEVIASTGIQFSVEDGQIKSAFMEGE